MSRPIRGLNTNAASITKGAKGEASANGRPDYKAIYKLIAVKRLRRRVLAHLGAGDSMVQAVARVAEVAGVFPATRGNQTDRVSTLARSWGAGARNRARPLSRPSPTANPVGRRANRTPIRAADMKGHDASPPAPAIPAGILALASVH